MKSRNPGEEDNGEVSLYEAFEPAEARRIIDATALTTDVDAWRKRRNTHHAKANWHFTATDARVKLKSL